MTHYELDEDTGDDMRASVKVTENVERQRQTTPSDLATRAQRHRDKALEQIKRHNERVDELQGMKEELGLDITVPTKITEEDASGLWTK